MSSRAAANPSGLPAGGSFQAVEHHFEAELELVAEVVAGCENLLDGHLSQVRVLIGEEPRQHRPRQSIRSENVTSKVDDGGLLPAALTRPKSPTL
jgi:hypothetical protein